MTATFSGNQLTYGYDANDRLQGIAPSPGSSGPTIGYLYDPNGNTIGINGGSGNSIVQYWDFDNRLLDTVHNGTNRISYAYDADGIRVAQVAPDGTPTTYVVDENTAYARVLSETAGSTGTNYNFGADLVRMDRSGGQYYYIYDGLGSTRQLVNSSGGAAQSINYDAYGQPDTASPPTNFLFNGQQYDPLTHLYYLRARYYNPFQGRFLSQDPCLGHSPGLLNLQRYLYADCDPINASDPGGTTSLSDVVTSTAIYQTFNSLCCYAGSQLFVAQATYPIAAQAVMFSGGAFTAYNMVTNPDVVAVGGPGAALATDSAALTEFMSSGTGTRIVYAGVDALDRPGPVMARLESDLVADSTDLVTPTGWAEFLEKYGLNSNQRAHLLARAFGGASGEVYNLVPMKQARNLQMSWDYEGKILRGIRTGRFQTVFYLVQGNFEGSEKFAESVQVVGIALDKSGAPVWPFNAVIPTH
jgi:RHS repeat-associated protein